MLYTSELKEIPLEYFARALERLRARPETAELPVVMVSGHASVAEAVHELHGAGKPSTEGEQDRAGGRQRRQTGGADPDVELAATRHRGGCALDDDRQRQVLRLGGERAEHGQRMRPLGRAEEIAAGIAVDVARVALGAADGIAFDLIVLPADTFAEISPSA